MARKERLTGVADIEARAPRVGKLKIGEVKETVKNGRTVRYPSKLDYIIAKDGAGNRVEAFHAVYGAKPVEFMAVFPSNDPREFYWEAYRRYGSGSGLACHGDGTHAILEETGESTVCPCQYAEPTIKDNKEYPPACKVVTSISLWLYEVPELGLFQIDTGSFRSMSNLKWFIFTGFPGLTGGQIAGIPIRVTIEPFQTLHDGKAATAYQWKFSLAPGMKPADLRVAAQKAVEGFILPIGPSAPMLDEGKPEDLYVGLPAATAQEEEEVFSEDVAEAIESLKGQGTIMESAAEQEKPVADPLFVLPTEWVERIEAAEVRLDVAMARTAMPQARMTAMQDARAENWDKTAEKSNWAGYERWLISQAETLEKRSGQGSLT